MPRKRNRSLNRLEVPCPHCGIRLWRGCGQKHYIFSSSVEQTRELMGTTRKKAVLLHTVTPTWVDRNRWIEPFFCSADGQIWMVCIRQPEGHVICEPAPSELWRQTTGTVDPNKPNPSVGEFTYRGSRGALLPG